MAELKTKETKASMKVLKNILAASAQAPRSGSAAQRPMRSLHDTGDRSALLERIELLSVESAARWGRMNVAQMLRHCAEAMRMATGELPVKPLGPWLLRTRAVKYLAFRVPIPKGAPTAPELRVADADVVEFASERTRLQDLVTQFAGLGPAAAAVAHPLFGALTSDEWSRLQYKHLDHHLRQFGV